MTVYPKIKDEHEQILTMNTIKNAMFYFMVIIFVLSWILLSLYQWGSNDHSVMAFAFSLGLLGSLCREGSRSLSYTQEKTKSAFISDFVYALLLVSVLVLLVLFFKIECSFVLATLGLCGIFLMIHELLKTNLLLFDKKIWIQELWPCAKWAIPGVLITWLNLNSYSIAAGYFINTQAVADINAARLFLMPISLGITAWLNLYRPRIVKYNAAKNNASVKMITKSSSLFVLIALPLYVLVVYLLYPSLSQLMGGKYHDIMGLIFLWSVYFLFCSLRTIVMALLMTSSDGYRSVTTVGYITSFISIILFFLFSKMGTEYVVSILAFIELIQLVFLLKKKKSRDIAYG